MIQSLDGPGQNHFFKPLQMATLVRTVKGFKGELKKNDHFFDKNPYKPKDRQGFFTLNDKKNGKLKPLTNGLFF